MFLDRFFSIIAGWLDQHLILPVLYRCGWMAWEELSFDWALICVYGLFAVLVTYAVCWPLEAAFPVERWASRKAVAVDVFYTLLSRVGVIPIVSFLLFYQAQVFFSGALVDHGVIPPTLETLIPPLFGHPLATFILYALILDFADYWRHRLSHSVRVWYALHALHHAQRQMSFWSDDRKSCAGRADLLRLVLRRRPRHRHPAAAIPTADFGSPLHGEPEPRQHPALLRPDRRAAADLPPLPTACTMPSAPPGGVRAITARCFRSGT